MNCPPDQGRRVPSSLNQFDGASGGVALVRAGAIFERGVLVERSAERAARTVWITTASLGIDDFSFDVASGGKDDHRNNCAGGTDRLRRGSI